MAQALHSPRTSILVNHLRAIAACHAARHLGRIVVHGMGSQRCGARPTVVRPRLMCILAPSQPAIRGPSTGPVKEAVQMGIIRGRVTNPSGPGCSPGAPSNWK